MHQPNEELCPIESLVPYANNARTHSKKQIAQIAESIRRFGFTNPVLIGEDREIIAGHGRVEAAKLLGMSDVPVRCLSHLNGDERRAYILADNKLAENAGWDVDILAIELQNLIDVDFDLELVGFSGTEIDLVLDGDTGSSVEADPLLDAVPDASNGPPVTQPGDLWILGSHRLLCGDARSSQALRVLCDDEPMSLMFTDPPYNVPIDGNVSGLGKHKHREFAFASGEMNRNQFIVFLTETLGAAAHHLKNGSIAYVCMDWRHMGELLEAGNAVFDELKNLCVWNKTNGGMGTFYRSKHELVFVFKKGTAPHINNFGLGDTGRYRTNVWDYAGISSLGAERDEELAMHPTVKPVALIADAIRDCSLRSENILDMFGGSGSTLIAAEQCGRKAYLLELDPIYCDTIIRRFEKITGQNVFLNATGERFANVEQARTHQPSPTTTTNSAVGMQTNQDHILGQNLPTGLRSISETSEIAMNSKTNKMGEI